jgi:hypothetical protein
LHRANWDIKDHPGQKNKIKGAQLGAQQVGTNSVAISIQGMPKTPYHAAAEICVSVVDEVVRLTEIWMAWPPFPYSLIKSSGLT